MKNNEKIVQRNRTIYISKSMMCKMNGSAIVLMYSKGATRQKSILSGCGGKRTGFSIIPASTVLCLILASTNKDSQALFCSAFGTEPSLKRRAEFISSLQDHNIRIKRIDSLRTVNQYDFSLNMNDSSVDDDSIQTSSTTTTTTTTGLIRNNLSTVGTNSIGRNPINVDGWEQQKLLIQSIKDKESKAKKDKAMEKYRQRSLGLIYDTAYFGFIIFSLLWLVVSNPFVPISYSVGAICGVAYAYGLSKYVESVGSSIDDVSTDSGAGVGAARFAFLLLLFTVVAKYRSQGLLEIPAILGFFTYQIASLNQGLREIND